MLVHPKYLNCSTTDTFSVHPYIGGWPWFNADDEDFALIWAEFHAVITGCLLQFFSEFFLAAFQKIDIVSKLQVAQRSSSDGHWRQCVVKLCCSFWIICKVIILWLPLRCQSLLHYFSRYKYPTLKFSNSPLVASLYLTVLVIFAFSFSFPPIRPPACPTRIRYQIPVWSGKKCSVGDGQILCLSARGFSRVEASEMIRSRTQWSSYLAL